MSGLPTSGPRHAGSQESWLQTARGMARELVWNGDFAFLLVLASGLLLGPWLGWVAAACYFGAVVLVGATLWRVRRRRR